MTEEKPKLKAAILTGQPGQPLQFTDEAELATAERPSPLCRAVARTIRAYHKAGRELLEGKYASAKAFAPPHLRSPCEIFVICCPDGVIVRYDRAAQETPKTRWTDSPESLVEAAPKFSEQVIHFPQDAATYVPSAPGPGLVLTVTDADGRATEHARLHPVIYASAALPPDFKMSAPPARPPALVSLHKELQLHLAGVVLPANTPAKAIPPPVDHFVAHGVAPLAVGWEAIEVYPLLDEKYWKPEYALLWAEQDLLVAIAQANAMMANLHRLDGRAAAREQHAKVIEEFEALLTGPEEPAHEFLKAHPMLLCPTHDAVWSKLPFGEHVSDFVFREPQDDYLLVEIEAPYRELFRKDGQQRQELTHAINQIQDWLQYIQDNKTAVKEKLGLVGISTTPRTLVVIGRNAGLSEENRRKLVVIQGQTPKLQILTYDEIILRARANLERLFGPLSMRARGLKLYFYREAVVAST
jgi:hypothetical protein